MTTSIIDRYKDDPEALQALQQERLILEVAHLICRAMEEKQIKRSTLAKELQKTKGWISQILHGNANLTIRTIANIFTAMGKELRLDAKDLFEQEHPLHMIEAAINYPLKATPYTFIEMTTSADTSSTLVA